MENFTFYNPTTIEFGSDKEQTIGQHLAAHGIKKVLLCYGSDRIKRDGLFATVSQRLAEHGVAFVELGGIVTNPLISKVREGIVLARAEKVDAILAVGGGSVLDIVKGMAAGVHYAGDVWYLFTNKAGVTAALPIFAIMTLAATGSEMNCSGVHSKVIRLKEDEKTPYSSGPKPLASITCVKKDMPAPRMEPSHSPKTLRKRAIFDLYIVIAKSFTKNLLH